MRLFLTFLIVCFSTLYGVSQEASVQIKVTEKSNSLLPTSTKSGKAILKQQLQETMKIYICQRCGTENHVNWNQPFSSTAFLPHCGVCGKKYWPKFEPSSAIQRTYCKLESETNLLSN